MHIEDLHLNLLEIVTSLIVMYLLRSCKSIYITHEIWPYPINTTSLLIRPNFRGPDCINRVPM